MNDNGGDFLPEPPEHVTRLQALRQGDERRGEMADGICPKDVEEDHEYHQASATEGCHIAPIHYPKD